MLPRFGSAEAPLLPLLDRRVTVFGFGNQGMAQALNLKDSGVQVCVALRKGSAREPAARAAGLECVEMSEGARRADVAALLVPDDEIPGLVDSLAKDWPASVTFVLAHSAAAARGDWKFPAGSRVACVAPAAPGVELRSKFTQGGGVTAFLALSDAEDESLRALGLAYGAAIGCARAGIFECTFAEERDVDLFGEQAVLCGGLGALVTLAFETLVGAGYPPEMAYLECVHQVDLTGRLIHDHGVEGMRTRISPAALYGDRTRGPRILEALRPVFAGILDDIRSGRFASELARGEAAPPQAVAATEMEAVRARLFGPGSGG